VTASTRPEWRGASQLTNRQRTGVEKKMIVFVIEALAVLYAVEEMGEARLTAACDHDTYVNKAPRRSK
jgi:hypothetical protein